jgi:hypothetical protein
MSYHHFISDHRSQLELTAREGFHSMVQRLGAVEASLDALIGLYQASEEFDPGLFAPFSQTLIQDFPFLKSIHFLSYVDDDDLYEFIAEMQDAGFSQFEMHRLRNPDAPVAWQSSYLVTSFVEPFTPKTARFMGAEWTAPGCLNDIPETLIASGKSEMIKAPKLFGPSPHFLLMHPTYFGRTTPGNSVEREQQVSGFFLIVIDNDELISSAIRRQSDHDHIQFAMSISNSRQVDGPTLVEENGFLIINEQIEIGESKIVLTTSSPLSVSANDRHTMLMVRSLTALLCLVLSICFVSRSRIREN